MLTFTRVVKISRQLVHFTSFLNILRRLLWLLVGQFWAWYWRNKMEIAAYFLDGTSYSKTYWQPCFTCKALKKVWLFRPLHWEVVENLTSHFISKFKNLDSQLILKQLTWWMGLVIYSLIQTLYIALMLDNSKSVWWPYKYMELIVIFLIPLELISGFPYHGNEVSFNTWKYVQAGCTCASPVLSVLDTHMPQVPVAKFVLFAFYLLF